MNVRQLCVWTVLLSFAGASFGFAQSKSGYEDSSPNFSGPGSTTQQLEEDDAEKTPLLRFGIFDSALGPWFEFKKGVSEDAGLQFGVNYNALYQKASDVPDDALDTAASGILRLHGRWTGLVDGGAFVFSGDHRHTLGEDIAPGSFGFQAGYLGIPGTLFTDVDEVLVDFHWQQLLNDGDSGFIAGRYDPNDFLDVLGYANPWTSFQNLAILFNASIALPDSSIGFGIGHWFNDNVYLKGTVNDANGVVTETKAFEGGSEFYSAVELGWTPAKDQVYFNKIHCMVWHADEREDAGVEESEGVTVSMNKTVGMRYMTFLKAGVSDGTAPIYSSTVTAGGIYYCPKRTDLYGLAFNWGEPADETLGDQITGEVFWRIQLAQNLAITPSVQFVQDPALNPDEDQLWITGVRARLTL